MSGTSKTEEKHWYLDATNTTYSSNGQPSMVNQYERHVHVSQTVTTGGSVPNYRQLIRHGQSATTGLDGTGYQIKRGDARAYQKVKSNNTAEQDTGCILASGVQFQQTVGSINTEADNKARSKLLAHYIGIRNEWRGGNFLAEIRETIHAFKHPLDTAYSSTLGWVKKTVLNKQRLAYVAERKRHDAKAIKSLRKALADDWLQYSFGIKPLIGDIQDASKAFNKAMDPERSDRIKISGRGLVTGGSITPTSLASNPGSIPLTHDKIVKTNSAVKYYGYIAARPYGNGLKMEKFGVDPFDVIPAVWEAIPFSWFVDYFVNVSEVLDGARLWNADVAWLNRGVRNSATVTQASLRCLATDATYKNREVTGTGAWTLCQSVQRRASSLPHPNWTFNMPGFPSLRWLNIASVLSQMTKGINIGGHSY